MTGLSSAFMEFTPSGGTWGRETEFSKAINKPIKASWDRSAEGKKQVCEIQRGVASLDGVIRRVCSVDAPLQLRMEAK